MSVRNPVRNSVGGVDCEYNHPQYGWIPFTASPYDTEELGRSIYADCVSGVYGPIAEYVAPPPEPTQVPQSVTRFQARAALMQAGLLADVEAYMALESTDAFIRLAWTEAQEFNRTSPTVLELASIIGVSDSELDDLFKFAVGVYA